jgi:hypothetical protein
MSKQLKHILNRKTVNAVVGYMVSMTVTGVSPIVCQSLLDNFYVSFKKTTDQILHKS